MQQAGLSSQEEQAGSPGKEIDSRLCKDPVVVKAREDTEDHDMSFQKASRCKANILIRRRQDDSDLGKPNSRDEKRGPTGF